MSMKGGWKTDIIIEVPSIKEEDGENKAHYESFNAYTFAPAWGGTGFYVGLTPGPNKELWVGIKEEDGIQKVTEVKGVSEGLVGDGDVATTLGLVRGHPERANFLKSDKIQNDIIEIMNLYKTKYPEGGNVPFLIFDYIFEHGFSDLFSDEEKMDKPKLGYYLWIHDFHHKDVLRTIEYKIGDATNLLSKVQLSKKGGKRKTRRVKKSYRKSYRKPNRKRRSNTKRHTHKH